MNATIDADAQERLLNRQLAQAKDAEAAAALALEDAQLLAATGGAAVPGAVVDAAESAKRQRVALEGALQAYARNVAADQQNAIELARAQREAQIEQALAEYRKHGSDLIAAIRKLLSDGAGAKAEASLVKLVGLLGGAQANVLSEQGWNTSSSLHKLRSGPLAQRVTELVQRTVNAQGPRGEAELVLDDFCTDLMVAVTAQPKTWPGA